MLKSDVSGTARTPALGVFKKHAKTGVLGMC